MKKMNFYKRVALIAFPVILQQIINMSVNLCDGIMVGQLKETAISGVSAGNQFYLLIVVFQSVSSVLTKGVLRGGGDTRFLMVADVLFLWVAAAPLGFLCGIVLELSSFWVYFVMKIDLVIKAIWCTYRLYRGTWVRDCV